MKGDDDDISNKKTDEPAFRNMTPRTGKGWYLDQRPLCASAAELGSYDTLTNVESEIRDKEDKKDYASTNKCRGASSEQLGKIGEWVSGTIDFILAKDIVAGITAWSWNLLNRADGFLLSGDPLEEKDKTQKSLIDKFKEVEKAAGKRKKKC